MFTLTGNNRDSAIKISIGILTSRKTQPSHRTKQSTCAENEQKRFVLRQGNVESRQRSIFASDKDWARQGVPRRRVLARMDRIHAWHRSEVVCCEDVSIHVGNTELGLVGQLGSALESSVLDVALPRGRLICVDRRLTLLFFARRHFIGCIGKLQNITAKLRRKYDLMLQPSSTLGSCSSKDKQDPLFTDAQLPSVDHCSLLLGSQVAFALRLERFPD